MQDSGQVVAVLTVSGKYGVFEDKVVAYAGPIEKCHDMVVLFWRKNEKDYEGKSVEARYYDVAEDGSLAGTISGGLRLQNCYKTLPLVEKFCYGCKRDQLDCSLKTVNFQNGVCHQAHHLSGGPESRFVKEKNGDMVVVTKKHPERDPRDFVFPF